MTTPQPTLRDLRLASLVLEPRVGLGEMREDLRRIDSVYGLLRLLEACSELDLVVEVGSFRGVSTEALLLYARRVHAVDPWEGLEPTYQQFLQRVKPYSHLEVLRMRSTEAAHAFADRSLDLVYLDGAHDLDSVRSDLRAWLPKVKPGKWIAGHDYSSSIYRGEVIQAVDEVLGVPHRVFEDSSWLVQVGT